MKFSKREAVKVGWKIFKKNWKFLLAAGAIVFVISAILNGIISVIPENFWPVTLVLGLFYWLLSLIFSIGLLDIYIKAVKKTPLKIADLFTHWRLVPKYFLAQMISGLVILFPVALLALGVIIATKIIVGVLVLLVGLILLVIVSTRLMFTQYFVVDKAMGPVQAVKASWRVTKGGVINLILFGLLLSGVILLGLLAFLVGLIVAIPVTSLATAYVYRQLSSQ